MSDFQLITDLEEGRVLDEHVPDLQFLAEVLRERPGQLFHLNPKPGPFFLELVVFEEELVLDGVDNFIIDEIITIFLFKDL